MTLSKNGLGIVAIIFSFIGLDVPEEVLTGAWDGILAVVSLGLLIYNQITRPDSTFFLFKK